MSRAALVRSGSGWRPARVVVLAEVEGLVTRSEALRILGVRHEVGLGLLAGLPVVGSGRRGDPRRYRRADVLAVRPAGAVPSRS